MALLAFRSGLTPTSKGGVLNITTCVPWSATYLQCSRCCHSPKCWGMAQKSTKLTSHYSSPASMEIYFDQAVAVWRILGERHPPSGLTTVLSYCFSDSLSLPLPFVSLHANKCCSQSPPPPPNQRQRWSCSFKPPSLSPFYWAEENVLYIRYVQWYCPAETKLADTSIFVEMGAAAEC